MESTQGLQYVCCVKFGSFFTEFANLLQVEKQLTAWAEIDSHINKICALKGIVHFNKHRVVLEHRKNVQLCARTIHMNIIPLTS